MSPTPTQQPAPDKPKRSRWLKGCLILLLVPFVALAFLYAWLVSEPAGYSEAIKASQEAREKILTPRLAPRETKSPPASSVPPSSLPTPSAAPISPEEARFWGDARARLEWKNAFLRSQLYSPNLSPDFPKKMEAEEWRMDPISNTPRVTPENAKAIRRKCTDLRVKIVRILITGIREPREDTVPQEVRHLNDPALVQKGVRTIREMDRLEGLFLDARWNGGRGLDPDSIDREWTSSNPVDHLIYLILHRALRNGDTAKASTLIERYVRLCGAFYFNESSRRSYTDIMRNLEEVLSWAASDPRVPEEILEWTATTLASWPLSPPEYSELWAVNLNRKREVMTLWLKERISSHDHGSSFKGILGRGTGEDVVNFIENQSLPILLRTLDRKTVALIHQDEAAYGRAQTIQDVAFLFMGHNRLNPIFDSPSFGAFYTPDDFLMRNAQNYAWQGTLVEKPGYVSSSLFGNLEDYSENTPYSVDLGPETAQSAFTSRKDREGLVTDDFNEPIAQVRLAFAAARYRREHGRYPASVEEMIPRYLGETFKPNSERFWTLVRMEPLHTVVTAASYDQKTVLEDPQTSASWSTAWWCVDPPSSFTEVLAAYADDPRNEGRAPEDLEDLQPYAKPDTDLAAFAPYFIQTDEYLLITRVLLKDPRQKAFYEFQKKMNAAQGKNDETLRPDTPFQSLYVSIPPWNPEVRHKGSPPPSPPASPKSGDQTL